jgi:hypothetical protein
MRSNVDPTKTIESVVQRAASQVSLVQHNLSHISRHATRLLRAAGAVGNAFDQPITTTRAYWNISNTRALGQQCMFVQKHMRFDRNLDLERNTRLDIISTASNPNNKLHRLVNTSNCYCDPMQAITAAATRVEALDVACKQVSWQCVTYVSVVRTSVITSPRSMRTTLQREGSAMMVVAVVSQTSQRQSSVVVQKNNNQAQCLNRTQAEQ